jgi:hypothetical protein
MKHFILSLLMMAAAVTGVYADDYRGQHVSLTRTNGDSLQYDLFHHLSMVPQVEDGKVVWTFNYEKPDYGFGDEYLGTNQYSFKVDDLKSIDFYTPEQSLARARQALVDFYKATDGDHWKINTNWCTDKPIGEWYGVTTGYFEPLFPYVYELRLTDGNDLQGTFPDGKLFARMGPITAISLWNNKLTGEIPENMYLNYALDRLNAGENQLTGSIPGTFIANPLFEKLELYNNKLTGPIPASIAKLMNYQSTPRVDISGNDLSGEVPQEIVNHPMFHLRWQKILPQSGHLTLPDIPAYKIDVNDFNGNQYATTDIYKSNQYTLIYNYSSARGDFSDKLAAAYEQYKGKGFEVMGMCPGDAETIQNYLHEKGITWLNIEPESFRKYVGDYLLYLNLIHLVDNKGDIVFTSLMDENGKMENTGPGGSTRDQEVFDVLADKFGKVDFTPYTSTDFSHDGEVLTLQQATVGKGIDIIFLGNAYVDKDMEPGGKYEQVMNQAMEKFFALEPFTSLRNRFNVYAVKAVSHNAELYDGTRQAIMTMDDVDKYAAKVTTLIPNRPRRINIIYNSYNAGRSITYMYDDNSYVAFMLTGVNDVLNHEGGGHGVGRLLDEYAEGTEISMPTAAEKTYIENQWTTFGRGANIDLHADVTQTRWARLAADARYATEQLGAYEGSGTFSNEVYRPTWNSMMRYNDIPFNAPSREAIYKYVMQESEGPDWQYDYETFVKFDQKGRKQFADALNEQNAPARRADNTQQQNNARQDELLHSLPPRIVNGTWRDALSNPANTIQLRELYNR